MRRNARGALSLLSAFGLLVVLGGADVARGEEAWEAIFISGNKVGHIHLEVARLTDHGRKFNRVRYETTLNFRRNGDPVTMKQRYGTIETPEGEVLRLDTRALIGEQEIRTFGDVVDGVMDLTLVVEGREQKKAIPWGKDVLGPYGPELSMTRSPLKPGESREVKAFIPDLNQICTVKLEAGQMEDVKLGGGSRSLLRVEFRGARADGKAEPALTQTVWVDKGGQILKGFAPVLGGMEFFRTTKAGALAPGGHFDQVKATIVKVPRQISDPERRRGAVYRVTLADGKPSEVFPNDRRQKVRPGPGPRGATIDVRAAGPNDGEAGPERVDDQFLKPSPMVDSADPLVVSRMREAVGNAVGPWDKAVAIENWVWKNIKTKDYSVAFAPATEVARNLKGDCTEHSLLTAAMCRAAGIPARVAVGLVYAPTHGGFGFHMWNEVYVNRRWVAIDSAFGESEVDAVHLKISESSLDGVSPLESLMAVAQVSNNLTIEVVELR